MEFYYIILLANFYIGVISSMENIKASYETDQKMLAISVKENKLFISNSIEIKKNDARVVEREDFL